MAPAAEKIGAHGDTTPADYLERLEQASIVNGFDSLMTFPRLAKLIDKGKIATHGAYFVVDSGDLSVLDKASEEFWPIERPS